MSNRKLTLYSPLNRTDKIIAEFQRRIIHTKRNLYILNCVFIR